jgi:hypothetical protein
MHMAYLLQVGEGPSQRLSFKSGAGFVPVVMAPGRGTGSSSTLEYASATRPAERMSVGGDRAERLGRTRARAEAVRERRRAPHQQRGRRKAQGQHAEWTVKQVGERVRRRHGRRPRRGDVREPAVRERAGAR